jgi:hypothetical protein
MAFTPDAVISSLGSTLSTLETDLSTFASQPDLSTTQLLQFQGMIGKWSLVSNLNTTIVKSLYDTFTGIVQKMS